MFSMQAGFALLVRALAVVESPARRNRWRRGCSLAPPAGGGNGEEKEPGGRARTLRSFDDLAHGLGSLPSLLPLPAGRRQTSCVT